MPQHVAEVSNAFTECEFFLHVTEVFLLHAIKLYAEQVSITVRCVPLASVATTRWQYWGIYLLGGGYTPSLICPYLVFPPLAYPLPSGKPNPLLIYPSPNIPTHSGIPTHPLVYPPTSLVYPPEGTL